MARYDRETSGGNYPCPVCGGRAFVTDSRPRNGRFIRRRRRCPADHRFVTYEIVVAEDEQVELHVRRDALRAAMERVRELQEGPFDMVAP